MSHRDAKSPLCEDRTGPVLRLITPRSKGLGGFSVRRVLPGDEEAIPLPELPR